MDIKKDKNGVITIDEVWRIEAGPARKTAPATPAPRNMSRRESPPPLSFIASARSDYLRHGGIRGSGRKGRATGAHSKNTSSSETAEPLSEDPAAPDVPLAGSSGSPFRRPEDDGSKRGGAWESNNRDIKWFFFCSFRVVWFLTGSICGQTETADGASRFWMGPWRRSGGWGERLR